MFLELSSKSLYLTLEKEKKRKLLSSVHVLLKPDIKKFHFVVVQRWQRNVQKSVMHVQSCCFAVLFFCRSPCRRCCLSSQMAPTVTPVLTSHANVLRYLFLMGGYTNFSSETLRTFFISTLFKRLVNEQYIGNNLKEGLKHFAAYALSRRICPMDFFLILKLKKTLGKKLTSLARATSFPGLSPSRPPEREDEDENAQGDELEGALGVSECLLTACHDRQIVDPVQFVESFLRFDTNSSSEIAQKNSITSSKVCN